MIKVPTPKFKVVIRSEELHRKKGHNEKVCCAQELGSYAQGQGHSRVRGQILPGGMLLINYRSKFDRTSQKDKA